MSRSGGRRHRLDAGAARNFDLPGRLSYERRSGGSARYPAGNDGDQSSETDDQHYAHDDNQDLERAHVPSFR